MSADAALLVEFGPGLTFRFENPPAPLLRPLRDLFEPFVVARPGPGARPISIRVSQTDLAPPVRGELIAQQPPVEARREGSTIWLCAPGVSGYCEGAGVAGRIDLHGASAGQLTQFVGQAVLPMLFELAQYRGWLGMHAAAVAQGGEGILLPGDSGCGKSTVFRSAAAAGFDTLSDDLVWLRETGEEIEIRPLPRGELDAGAPAPSIWAVPLRFVVCPSIVEARDSRLTPLAPAEVVQTLIAQSGFLSGGRHAGARFQMLVRIARAAPAYRLGAGSDRAPVPLLLKGLMERR